MECEALGVGQRPPAEHVRVRLHTFDSNCMLSQCEGALGMDGRLFFFSLHKALTRLPGCEQCQLRGFDQLVLRDVVVHARRLEGDAGGPWLAVDPRFPPDDVQIVNAAFTFRRPGSETLGGYLERVCEEDVGCLRLWEE